MSPSYVLLSVTCVLGATQLVLTWLAGRWLLTGQRPRFMTFTRLTAYANAATTACTALAIITIARHTTHTAGRPLPFWVIGMAILAAIALATGAMYAADRSGRARRTAPASGAARPAIG